MGSRLQKAGPIPLGARRINLNLDAILFATVNGYIPGIFQNYAGFLDAQGLGKAAILIPNDTALIGIHLHSAFVTLKAGEPLNIKSISNTWRLVITK